MITREEAREQALRLMAERDEARQEAAELRNELAGNNLGYLREAELLKAEVIKLRAQRHELAVALKDLWVAARHDHHAGLPEAVARAGRMIAFASTAIALLDAGEEPPRPEADDDRVA